MPDVLDPWTVLRSSEKPLALDGWVIAPLHVHKPVRPCVVGSDGWALFFLPDGAAVFRSGNLV